MLLKSTALYSTRHGCSLFLSKLGEIFLVMLHGSKDQQPLIEFPKGKCIVRHISLHMQPISEI